MHARARHIIYATLWLQNKLPPEILTEGLLDAERDATRRIDVEHDVLEKKCDATYAQYYLDISARYGIVAVSRRSAVTKTHPSEFDDNIGLYSQPRTRISVTPILYVPIWL